jgi:hypothetical protein
MLGTLSLIVNHLQKRLVIAWSRSHHEETTVGRLASRGHHKIRLQQGPWSVRQFHQIVHVDDGNDVGIHKNDATVFRQGQDAKLFHVDVGKRLVLWRFHVSELYSQPTECVFLLGRQSGGVGMNTHLQKADHVGRTAVLFEKVRRHHDVEDEAAIGWLVGIDSSHEEHVGVGRCLERIGKVVSLSRVFLLLLLLVREFLWLIARSRAHHRPMVGRRALDDIG